MVDLPLYRSYYHRLRGLIVEGRSPATGKEKRNHQTTKEPYSRLESKRNLSNPAKWLLQAKGGDEEALYLLICYLGEIIKRHADHENWRIGCDDQKAFNFAAVALWPHVHAEELSDAKAATMIGVAKRSYQKSWKPRLHAIQFWICFWRAEAKI